MSTIELTLSILAIVVPIVGTLIVTTWKISGWVASINAGIGQINQRLGDGQERFEELKRGHDNHEKRITVLETEHTHNHLAAAGEGARRR